MWLLVELLLSLVLPPSLNIYVTSSIGQILMVGAVWTLLKGKGASWGSLGVQRFTIRDVGLGCGLVILAFVGIAIHNTILWFVGVESQGIEIYRRVQDLESLWGLAVLAVFTAPLVEELFF